MRPLPAQRIGTAHGLLRALDERGRLRLDQFVTEFTEGQLFPADSGPDTGRTRQYLSLLRSVGLAQEDRGAVELTDFGRRYVRAGDRSDPFAVSAGQAEWLRRALRERHMTDSIWHGAAIALSLYATLGEGEWVSLTDFGRCAAHLGRVGWDNENTFHMQGERFTRLLQDLELIGGDRRLTPIGDEMRRELRLPVHIGLTALAGQLHPGGPAGAEAAGREERSLLGLDERDQGPAADSASPPSGAAAPDPGVAAAAGYETVVGSVAAVQPMVSPAASASASPSPSAPPPPMPPPAAPPVPPPPTAAGPDVATSAYAAATPPPVPPPPVPPLPDPPAAIPPTPQPQPEPPRADVAPAPVATPAPAIADPFLDPETVRRAAERRGLQLEARVYAAVIAALATGRHLVLTGGAGRGKTTLARALAEAARTQGRSSATHFAAAGPGLSARDLLGRRGPDGFEPGLVRRALDEGAWLILDELDRARVDRLLGRLSPLLGGEPLESGEDAPRPPAEWRLIATLGDSTGLASTSHALRRRFAFIEVPSPSRPELESLVERWAAGDAVAAAVGRRLVAMTDHVDLGVAIIRDAVAYAHHRRAMLPDAEETLAREALAAFVLPQLQGLPEDVAARAAAAAGLPAPGAIAPER